MMLVPNSASLPEQDFDFFDYFKIREYNLNHEGPGPKGGQFARSKEFLSTPSDAIDSLAEGHRVTVAREDIRGVLYRAAKSNGVLGPLDLTKLTVEGTPIFAGGLNIKREQMPQIHKEHQAAFVAFAKAKGIAVEFQSVSPAQLRPTQNGISAVRVGQKLKEYDSNKSKKIREIMVSGDGYVLDGHHRWAVMAAVDVEGGAKSKVKILVIRFKASHRKVLRTMLEFTKKHNIPGQAL